MIERYTPPKMKKIFSNNNKFSKYLLVEKEVAHYLSIEGIIPQRDFELIKNKAKFDLKGIAIIEKETKHDVIAFTRNVSSYLGPEKKRIHYGLTSTDVVDTAMAVIYKEANKEIYKNLKLLKKSISEKAKEYKYTPCIGRTHGIHADITSFGLKWLLYFDELTRDEKRFLEASSDLETGKISGAVGTFVYLPPECQDFVCEQLKINSSKMSTQVLQRDRHAYYMSTITLIGSLLEKIAIEIRNLQRTEIHEVEEYFSKKQKGSSAMPHKHNPIGSENICGCNRLLKGYMLSIFEDIPLYHERDISHSSVERVALVDAITLIDYMIIRMTSIINSLNVYPERMKENITLTHNVIYSQRIMTTLINKGLSRETAYDLIQPLAIKTYEENINFFDLIKKNDDVTKYISCEEIDHYLDSTFATLDIDKIYSRIELDKK
jgi:adenylosuccinate lyase